MLLLYEPVPKAIFVLNRQEFSGLWAWLIIRNTRLKKQILSFGMNS